MGGAVLMRGAPIISEKSVGQFYVNEDDGSVWRCVSYAVSYADAPTAALARVWPWPGEQRRVSGVVGAPIFAPFRLLKAVRIAGDPK
jgi:hypothetical protein